MSEAFFPAMGTIFHAVLADGTSIESVRDHVRRAENRFSRFLPGSELSRINRSRRRVIKPSDEFSEVLELAAKAKVRTDGLVDAGVGGLVVNWGYDRPYDQLTEPVAGPQFGAGEWEFDGTYLSRAPDVHLDFGGLVKGWVCDRAVDGHLASVLSGGGDLRSADPSCVVRVRDPWGGVAASIRLGVGGLATSSVTRRTWIVDGVPAHHLIDPRTGRPADSPAASATVVADTSADAEAGAKAVLLRGNDGLAWAAGQSWIRAAMVIWHDRSVFATTTLELTA